MKAVAASGLTLYCYVTGICQTTAKNVSDACYPPTNANTADEEKKDGEEDSQASTGSPMPDPDDEDNTKHAKKRMAEQNVSQERVDEAKRIGRKKEGNDPGTTVYDVASKDSKSGRGVRIVVDDKSGRVITVIDKGSKYK